MAPLRFRAWHKTLKKVVPVTGLHFFEAVELSSLSFDSAAGEQQCWPIDEFIVMQSTGLLDKNGVLIYEGDVVVKRCKFPKYERIGVVQWGRDDRETGMWERKTVRFAGGDTDLLNRVLEDPYYEPFGLACGCDELEVIGNIHQHPHLLPPQ